ncbi:hypothetical protein [Streptomyces sp. NPDC101393]|uniref:DUF6197 family protein n=1 Tax=Streptomyces sp. NPDC101393 TaxID=3366141 RepID=UPI00380A47EF
MTITTAETVALVERVAEELAAPRMWWGMSGHRVTGEAVARHLEAAADLMEREGWDPQFYAPLSGHSIVDALNWTARDGAGDADTRYIARTVTEALLRALTGAPYVDCEVWGEHSSRRLPEILTALRGASRLARLYGPEGSGAC